MLRCKHGLQFVYLLCWRACGLSLRFHCCECCCHDRSRASWCVEICFHFSWTRTWEWNRGVVLCDRGAAGLSSTAAAPFYVPTKCRRFRFPHVLTGTYSYRCLLENEILNVISHFRAKKKLGLSTFCPDLLGSCEIVSSLPARIQSVFGPGELGAHSKAKCTLIGQGRLREFSTQLQARMSNGKDVHSWEKGWCASYAFGIVPGVGDTAVNPHSGSFCPLSSVSES